MKPELVSLNSLLLDNHSQIVNLKLVFARLKSFPHPCILNSFCNFQFEPAQFFSIKSISKVTDCNLTLIKINIKFKGEVTRMKLKSKFPDLKIEWSKISPKKKCVRFNSGWWNRSKAIKQKLLNLVFEYFLETDVNI